MAATMGRHRKRAAVASLKVSEAQAEIAALKKRVAKLESENAKLRERDLA